MKKTIYELDINQKVILLNFQNNNIKNSNTIRKAAKNFDILATNLSYYLS